MFAAARFPFADARPFLSGQTNRLDSPQWPLPVQHVEFLRGFGPVVPRRRGGIESWPSEEVFCEASRAVRFEPFPQVRAEGRLGVLFYFHCLFRRFFYDGSAVARLELGLKHRMRSSTRFHALSAAECLSFLEQTVSLSVRVPGVRRPHGSCPLIELPKRLAAYYLTASTHIVKRRHARTQPWWFTPAVPLLLVEYHQTEINELPPHSRQVQFEAAPDIRLDHYWMSHEGNRFGVWFLGVEDQSNRDLLRRLRLHLFRLHAEQEALKEILRLIARKRINIKPRTGAGDRLQEYLRDSLRLLTGEARYGLPQSDLLRAAEGFESVVLEGERATLLTQLGKIRTNILRSVERYTVKTTTTAVTVFNVAEGGHVTTINLGDHNTFHRDFVVADTIQNSFNKLENSGIPQELQGALKALHERVAALATHLPDESARRVASDLQVLTTEATSKAPRRQWYTLSADGLIEAAKAVSQLAAPVTTAVKAVLALLV